MRWRWLHGGHEVVLEWSFWTGRRRLSVDGQALAIPGGMLASKIDVPLALEGTDAHLELRLRYLTVATARMIADGQEVAAEAAPADVPAWTWLFVVATAGILVASRGGALWGALVGVAAVSCIGVSRTQRPEVVRLVVCAAIAGAAWVAFFALSAWLAGS